MATDIMQKTVQEICQVFYTVEESIKEADSI